MMDDDDFRGEMEAVAAVVYHDFPNVAGLLRALAIRLQQRPTTTHARKRILRALPAVVYSRFSDDAASKLISAAWAAWEESPSDNAPIGSAGFYLKQLAALGYRSVGAKKVFNDITL
jgi:hypothetical protein